MSSAKGPPPGPPGQRGRRRRAPTIDLTATEIASQPVQPEPEPQMAAPAQPEPVIAAPVQPEPAPPPQPERVEAAPAEPPRRDDTPVHGAGGGEQPPPPPGNRPGIAWLPPDFPWLLVGAGAAGAVLALIIVFIVSLFPGRESGTAAIDTRLDARLGRVEQQLRELAARPAPADPRAIEDLASRLSRLETAGATPRPPMTDPAVANRMAALEGELRALGEREGVLLRRNDEIATIAGEARKLAQATLAAVEALKKAARADAPAVERKEFEAMAARLAALEKTLKSVESQLSQQTATANVDRVARLLTVVMALDTAVMSGRPFVAELAAAKEIVDTKTLAPLEPFAKTGVPTAEMLARELMQVLPAVAKAIGGPKSDGGFLDRLKANAGKIIRVRPTDEIAGDDPAAVLSRIEARAAQADIDGALLELGRLPEAARAPARAWIERAKARNAAIDSFRRYIFGMVAPAPFSKSGH